MKTAEEILEIIEGRLEAWRDLQREFVESDDLLVAAKYQIRKQELLEVISEIKLGESEDGQEGRDGTRLCQRKNREQSRLG